MKRALIGAALLLALATPGLVAELLALGGQYARMWALQQEGGEG